MNKIVVFNLATSSIKQLPFIKAHYDATDNVSVIFE